MTDKVIRSVDESIGRKVKQLRREKGLTQSELAEMLDAGVKQQNIAQLEDGTVSQPRYLHRLLGVLGTTYEELMGPNRFTSVGSRIRELMQSHSLTQVQLSEETGVTQSTIQRIISGEIKSPKNDHLLPIANYFDISIDELYRTDEVSESDCAGYIPKSNVFQGRLRELRSNAGLTIGQLSERIDTSPRSISYWEKGEKDPAASMVVAISKEFGVSADYLLGLDESEELLSPPLGELGILDMVSTIEDMSIRKLVVMSHRGELSKPETKVLLSMARALFNARNSNEN